MSETTQTVLPQPRRRIGRGLLLGLLALVLLLAVLLLFLLRSGVGRDLALGWLQQALPEGALQWERAEGQLHGGLVLHQVRYRDGGVQARLARLELDLDAVALLRRRLHLRRLLLSDASLELPPATDTPTAWPQRLELPATLPDLELPLALHWDRLELRALHLRQGGEPQMYVRSLETAGQLSDGVLAVETLALDSDRLDLRLSGRFDSRRNWASQAQAQARLALDEASAPLPLDLRLAGDLDDLKLQLESGDQPSARLALRMHGGLPRPQWQLDLDAQQLPPQWAGASDLGLMLKGEGDLDQGEFSGVLRHGEQQIELQTSRIAYADAQLRMQPLALALLQGQASLHGVMDLAQQPPHWDVRLEWQDIVLPGAQSDSEQVRSQGQASVRGPLDGYALNLEGRLLRAAEALELRLQGQGSLQALEIALLEARLPGGALQAEGRVAWAPEVQTRLQARLAHFDPSYFAPAFPGAVNASLVLDGGLSQGQLWGQGTLTALGGTLRGRRLAGSARFEAGRDGKGDGELALHLGDSHVQARGSWGAQQELTAQLRPLHLADLLPDAGGRMQGQVELRANAGKAELTAQLQGRALVHAGQQVERLDLELRLLDWAEGVLALEARDLNLAGLGIEQLELQAEGRREQHQARLHLRGPDGRLQAHLSGALQDHGGWQGLLHQLDLAPQGHAAWTLRAPGTLARSPEGVLSLSETCLEAGASSLCARIQADAHGGSAGQMHLQGFELAQLAPLLSTALEQPLALRGTLGAHADFRREPSGALRGEAVLELPALDVRLDPAAARSLADLRHLRATLALEPEQARFGLEAALGEHGHLRARLDTATPLQEDGALSGELDLLLPEIDMLELFSDAVVAPSGRLQGQLGIAGRRSAPRLSGRLSLSDFAAEIPALGIVAREGQMQLSSNDASQARLQGSVMLGEGMARIDGDIDLQAEGGARLRLGLKGEDLSVMNTPQAQVKASPDLRIELAGKALKLRGTVDVPWARIDLEHLQSATLPSSDEVIVDETESTGAMAVDTNVAITLGKEVRMNGYGLKGTLAGRLRLRDKPGRASSASGTIEVGGSYKAYGQDLRITRGRVAYSSSPLENPALNIRAERKVDAIMVGIQVRGTALVPELTLWSNPAMEQAEQLSYLVLGRPLRSASQADGAQLSQAAAAMGGNLLAKTLGARMGLDEVGVADNRALGGAALTVGMNLSPRLHVSYGVSLFGSGQVVTFKYLLGRLWNIQIDSGTESRAALNYRLEK